MTERVGRVLAAVAAAAAVAGALARTRPSGAQAPITCPECGRGGGDHVPWCEYGEASLVAVPFPGA